MDGLHELQAVAHFDYAHFFEVGLLQRDEKTATAYGMISEAVLQGGDTMAILTLSQALSSLSVHM